MKRISEWESGHGTNLDRERGRLGAWEKSLSQKTIRRGDSETRGKTLNTEPETWNLNRRLVLVSFRTSRRGRDEPESSGTIIINTIGLRVCARSDGSGDWTPGPSIKAFEGRLG